MTISNIDLEHCTKCSVCEDVCPNDVIRMDSQTGLPKISYREDCSVCFICEEECPEKVITVEPTHSGIVTFPY